MSETTGSANGARPRLVRRQIKPSAVLFVAAFGAFMAFVDATIVNVAFPNIAESFPGSDLGEISWVLNAYNIVFAAFLIAAGRICDLLGRKKVFEWGVALFTAASVLCAIAPSLGFLVAMRMFQALGAALLVPSSLALVIEAYPATKRSEGVALYTAVSALAAGIGPAIGGVLVDISDWRLTFLVNVPFGIAAWMLSKRRLVESRAPGRRSMPDLFGALVLALAIGALTLGIIKGQDWGWVSAGVLISIAVFAVALAYFIRRCRWHKAPLVRLELFRIRSFSLANTITSVAAAGYFSYILTNVLYLTEVWHYSEVKAGLALTPGPIAATVVAAIAGRVADRIDFRLLIVPGCVIWAIGVYMAIAVVGPTPHFVSEWLPTMIVLGIGAGLAFPTLGSAAVSAAPGNEFAMSTALNSVSRQLGATLGVAILVAIVGHPKPQEVLDAFDRGWTFAAVCLLTAGIGAIFLGQIRARDEAIELDDEPFVIDPETLAEPELAAAEVVAPTVVAAAKNGRGRTDADFLALVPMFKPLTKAQRAEIAQTAKTVKVAGGDYLFRQGDAARGLYVVRSGRLEVVLESEGGEEVIAQLQPGDVVGELALLSGEPRAASIRARRDAQLLQVSRRNFDRLMKESNGMALALSRVLGRQLAASKARAAVGVARPAVFAITAAQPAMPLDEVAERLAGELGRWGSLAFIREAPCAPEDFGPTLERLETEHDRVLLVAPDARGEDPWSAFCLRQADRILVMAGEGDPPHWVEGQARLKGCTLLNTGVLGEEVMRPWIAALEPKLFHRIAPFGTVGDEVAALARRLAGTSVGLVLSGGGARGLAHIGVIAELERAGIVIDRIAGCSMGAFLAALYAQGHDAEELEAIAFEEWVQRQPLNDYRIPNTSLIRGEKIKAMLARRFPGDVDRTVLPFFSVSCDLLSGDLVVHRKGWLPTAVGASMCLPALAPPVSTGGRLLVDGGIRNNLPVDIMAADDEGPIIASDVTAVKEAVETNGNGAFVSDAFEFDESVGPPSLGEVLLRCIVLGSIDTAAAAEQYASMVVRPPNDGAGMLEFHQIDQLILSGRRAAREALRTAPPELFRARADQSHTQPAAI